MNERFKRLAEYAGIAVWDNAVYMYHPKDILDSTVLIKFAELIVRECADIADNAEPYKANYLIKRRFGVE